MDIVSFNDFFVKERFLKTSLERYKKKYQEIYFLLVSVLIVIQKNNTSTQFKFKKKRKCAELNRLLIQNIYKMKSILQINISLMNINVEER